MTTNGAISHTPGPWRVFHEGGESFIGQPCRNTLGYRRVITCEAVSVADARLLAAAPDMLAVLKQTTETLDWLLDNQKRLTQQSRRNILRQLGRITTVLTQAGE